MISFTLEILNVFLLFRYVLGYEFRKKRSPIVIGIIVIALDYVLRVIYYDYMPLELEYLLPMVLAVLPILFFYGRKTVLLLMGVFIVTSISLIDTLSWGIATLAMRGDIIHINFQLADLMARLVCTGGILLISVLLKRQRKKIHFYNEKMSIIIFLPFIISIFLIQFQAAYSGAEDPNWAHMIQGMNMTKSGLLGIFIILTFVLVQGLISQKKELGRMLLLNQKCIKEQTAQYQMIGSRDKELRKFRHDYNQHLLVMQDMAGSEKYEELAKYVGQLGEIQSKANFISTDNIICDAIVNQYYSKCRECGIKFSIIGKMPPGVDILETDLCLMLSNGIENAYEAALQCEGEKSIEIKIRSLGNFTFIEIINSVDGKVSIEDGFIKTTKEDKENHGFGTKNMREAALRSGGSVAWEFDPRGFVITKIYLRGCKNE